MSIRYRAADGTETICAGLTPGGDIEAGAVATRSGTKQITVSANSSIGVQITFSDPMPDADYDVNIEITDAPLSGLIGGLLIIPVNTSSKTANGFEIAAYNNTSSSLTVTVSYKATKTYTVQHAEQTAADIADIKAMIPSTASSTNKFSTADDLRTETRALDRRLDDVEDVIPTTASITNQLATQNDLSNIEIDELGEINDVDLANLADGQTLVWDDTTSKWVNGQGGKVYTAGDGIDISSTDEISAKVNPAQFDFDAGGKMSLNSEYKKTFIGTKAEWDALSASKKKEYTIANITDDVIGGEVADVVQDGLMSPVTSNAVYNAISKLGTIYSGTQNVTLESSTSITSVDLNTVLPAGVYLVTVTFAFNINNNGYRFSRIGGATTATETTAATNGEYTTHNLTDVCVLNSDGKINVALKQNSGSDIVVILRYGIIRLRV